MSRALPNKRRMFIAIGMILGAGAPATARKAPLDNPADAPSPATRPASPAYGKTPDTAIPYRNFHEPYHRFFQQVMEFRGAGRDDPPAVKDQVRIGFMGPTGAAADGDLGERMLEGVRLAIEQANAEGGYDGAPFALVIRPDVGLWGATSNEMAAFAYEDEVVAVIGSIDGANTHIALRVALKTEMAIVNTATTDPTLTETNIPWIIRCMGDDRQQGYALAGHIFEECGIDKIAILRVNNRYGRTGIAEFRDAARRLGRPATVEMRWAPGTRDFTAQLDRIAQTDPQAVILWGNASDTAAVVKEIRRRNLPVRIFGCDRLVSRTFLDEAGDAAEGVVAVASCDLTRDDPRVDAFKEAFAVRFDHEPETFAAHAYDGANILIATIRKTGLNRAAIRDGLYQLDHYAGVTGPIEFDTTLNDIGPVYLAEASNGRYRYREATFPTKKPSADSAIPHRALRESPPAARSPARDIPAETASYRIGCFVPLDDTGQAAVEGAKMALAEDAAAHPSGPAIELLVRDARGAWGGGAKALVDLVLDDEVLAIVGSTERGATHLIETLAAKFHFPVLALCGADPTITAIPLAWVFCVAPNSAETDPSFVRRFVERVGRSPDAYAAGGYDAANLVAKQVRAGALTRLDLRNGLSNADWYEGAGGAFRFDALGNRVDRQDEQPGAARMAEVEKH